MKQNRRLKRGISIILILIMTISYMGVFADTSNSDFTLTGVVGSSSKINPGDIFTYTLTITANGAITKIKAQISGDFVTASGNEIDFGDLTNASKTIAIPVKYTGSSDRMNIFVYSTADANKSIVDNIVITKALVTSTSTSQPVNKDKYYPEFNLSFTSSTPKFVAGSNSQFKFNLENITNFQARDVEVSLINDSEDFPFVDMTNTLITSKTTFKNKEKQVLSIPVIVKESTPSGFYTIPVKIVSKNVYGLSKEVTKKITVEIVNNTKLPSLVIEEIVVKDNILIPGEDSIILLRLKNLGSIDVKNVNVELKGISLDGVTLKADSAKKVLRLIDSNSDDFVTYNISVSDKLSVSTHEMSIDVNYYDQYGTKYTETLPVYLPIDSISNNLFDLDVKISSMPNKVVAGNEFTIKFDLENKSNVSKKDLKITIKSDANLINKSQPVLIVNELKAGEKKSFVYTLISRTETETNNYPTYITVEKKDGSSTNPLIKYLGVYIDGESGAKSKPKIIIDSYDYGGDTVLAGEEFDLSIVFFNTSSSMGIRNAKVSVSVDENAFAPVNSASSFFIDSIGSREKVTKVIRMKAKTDLAVKTYNVTTAIEYEDSLGNSYDINKNPYEATESMGVPVMQEIRLEIEEIALVNMYFVYQPFELFTEFFNMGKSTLANMLITTEGDFEVEDGKSFVGNFAPGSSEFYSCMIIPLNPGENTGVVKFEFEDAMGEKHVIEKQIAFNAMEMEENIGNEGDFNGGDFGGEFPIDQEPVKKGITIKGVLIVLVPLVIIVIVIINVRKRKKQREMDLDE